MKKSLIALAALAATGAFAQSSVTLFGVVDIGYGSHTTTGPNGASIKSSGVMDGGLAGSRIGFRGTEDLGGGLKADFWVEQGISPTNGALFGVRSGAAGHQVDGFSVAGGAAALSGTAGAYTQSTNRQTYLGLTSGAGTLRVGYQYTNVYELATLSGYALGSEGVQGADKSHLYMWSQAGGTRSNAITYISPRIGGGLTLRVQYGAGSANRDTYDASAANAASGLSVDKNQRTSIMAQDAAGPLSAALAYTTNKVTQSARATAFEGIGVYGAILPATTSAITNTGSRTAKLLQLGGSYDFGVAKVAGTYNDGDNGGTGSSTDNSSFKAYQVGVSVPFGAAVPFVAIGKAKTTNDRTAVVSEDYKQQQVGVRYSLSKRTTAYVRAESIKDDAGMVAPRATIDVSGNTKISRTAIGVRHTF